MTYADRRRKYLDRRQKHIVAGSGIPFNPSTVAEIAAGFYWDPLAAVNSGLATFLLPEAQGKTAADQITPSLAAAPTIIAINGRAAIQHINRTSPSIDSLTRSSAQIARGWTGATLFAAWFSMSAAPGFAFGHWRPVNNFGVSLGGTRIDVLANDGVTTFEQQHAVSPTWMALPIYIEILFDPAQVATNRLQLWFNRVQVTASFTVAMTTTVRDTASFLGFSGVVSDGNGFNISADFAHGVAYLCNGIPSNANRDRMYGHRSFL